MSTHIDNVYIAEGEVVFQTEEEDEEDWLWVEEQLKLQQQQDHMEEKEAKAENEEQKQEQKKDEASTVSRWSGPRSTGVAVVCAVVLMVVVGCALHMRLHNKDGMYASIAAVGAAVTSTTAATKQYNTGGAYNADDCASVVSAAENTALLN